MPGDAGMPLGGPRLRTSEGRSNQVGFAVRTRRRFLKIKQDSLCARIVTATQGDWNPDRLEVLRIEQGTRSVTDLELLALARALDCDPCALLIEQEMTQPTQSSS